MIPLLALPVGAFCFLLHSSVADIMTIPFSLGGVPAPWQKGPQLHCDPVSLRALNKRACLRLPPAPWSMSQYIGASPRKCWESMGSFVTGKESSQEKKFNQVTRSSPAQLASRSQNLCLCHLLFLLIVWHLPGFLSFKYSKASERHQRKS